MIKIEPLIALDFTQTRALLRHRAEPAPPDQDCTTSDWTFRGLSFWQHWLPCQMHLAPSVYVAKEDGVVLGLITIQPTGKSKQCWQIDHLIVHPLHRGRGVAQELLRFAFALFGSQGVSHFISEVSTENSAALQLYGSCGFRRCAKVSHYRLEIRPDDTPALVAEARFRLAIPADRQGIYQLHQEMLPPDIRLIFSYSPDDFSMSEIPIEKVEKLRTRMLHRKVWYWISEDRERRVITSAVRVTCHRQGDYHLEFAVHPGFRHLGDEIVPFALNSLRMGARQAVVWARAFDFQPGLAEVLEAAGMERTGDFCLLAREHWLRAKQPKLKKERGVSLLANPGVNMPLATDRNIFN